MQPAPPTSAEIHALVESANRFREAAPWLHVSDEQVFGILDPEHDEIAYAVISGPPAIACGLSLFPGSAGLATLRRMQFELLPDDTDDLLIQTRSLICAFTSSETLEPRDRRFLEGAGLRLHRGESWPYFISHEPGYGSWTVSGAEARLFRIALDQSLVMAEAIMDDPTLLEQGSPGEFLVRVLEDESAIGAWSGRWMRPPDTRDLCPPKLDEVTAARLARMPFAEAREWEVDAVTGMGLLAEGESVRPRVLRVLTVIERGTAYMHDAEVLEAPEFNDRVAGLFVEQALAIGYRPRRILVRDYALRNLLARVARAMNSKLFRLQYLPLIEQAQTLLRERRRTRSAI